mmetsp:Transcript_417/g.460  ORF Transcript_417/g.460 Transcript_417/m.460 type:complete len:645 (-) Transcript_417:87-2021(-)
MIVHSLNIVLGIAVMMLSSVIGKELNYVPLIPYHQNRERRRRKLFNSSSTISNEEEQEEIRRRTSAVQVGALYQGYGTHYIDLWVGTPNPQRQTLIVDTGSGVSAFPCSGCKNQCGDGHHIDSVFDEGKSKTFTKVKCNDCKRGSCTNKQHPEQGECKISMSYQEGSSWYAFEARDQAYIGGPHDHGLVRDNGGDQDIDPNHAKAFSFDMTFGCQTRLTGLFKTQLADGIMGMDIADTAFNKMMHTQKKVPGLDFSLCFARQPTAEREGTESGAMTMGGYDERFHKSPLVYTKNNGQGGKGFYNVHIRKIYLRDGSAGESVLSTAEDPKKGKVLPLNVAENQLNNGRVIVDSGTTDTYLSRVVSAEYKKAFKALSGLDYNHNTIQLTDEQLHALPTLIIQLQGDVDQNKKLYPDPSKVAGLAHSLDGKNPYDVLIAISPSHYMEYDDKQEAYINRLYADERGGSVLGANAMMGHDVYFDQENMRIGWAESDCDYYNLVTNNGFMDTLVPEDLYDDKKKKSQESTKKTASDNNNNNGFNDKDENKIDVSLIEKTWNTNKVHPALAACDDIMCQGTLAGALVLFLIAGVVLGRRCGKKSKGYNGVNNEDPALEMRGLVLNDGYSDELVDEEESSNNYKDADAEVMS